MLVILAKCHFPQGTCWFYEVGLSNRKIDWLSDWLTDSQIYKVKWEKKGIAFQLWTAKQAVFLRDLIPKFHSHKCGFIPLFPSFHPAGDAGRYTIQIENSWEVSTVVYTTKLANKRPFSFLFFVLVGHSPSPTSCESTSGYLSFWILLSYICNMMLYKC